MALSLNITKEEEKHLLVHFLQTMCNLVHLYHIPRYLALKNIKSPKCCKQPLDEFARFWTLELYKQWQ